MNDYVRVRFTNTIPRPVWAIRNAPGVFTKCNKFGEWGNDNTRRIFIALPDDIAWEKPARMNNKYGELEVVKNNAE